MARSLVIAAAVDACERPVVERAAVLLADVLRACGDAEVEVTARFVGDIAALVREPAPDCAVASLLPELAGDEPVAAVDERWREALAAWPATMAPVLVCTIFRHVDPTLPGPQREAVRERIRRLTLAAIGISHDTGAHVVDFDRTLAHVGARTLASDHRFGSAVAIDVAARTLVRSLLAVAGEASIAADVASRAEARIGQPWDALAGREP
ncbi:MAG: hypothetical protein IT516_11320 [Burkholderiales bacterium]|nr:hypothetical protein [Burkholderiales bacterium]